MGNWGEEGGVMELAPVLERLTDRFTGKASTSVTYEEAQRLLGAALYCIRETEGEYSLAETDGKRDVMAIYREGYQRVCCKAERVKELFEEMAPHFDGYGVRVYEEVLEAIPVFLERYDPEFDPQDTILTLDYPVLGFDRNLEGVDAVYQYLYRISLEQEFLEALPDGYVGETLSACRPGVKGLIVNPASIVLRNILANLAADKKLCGERMREHYDTLEEFVLSRSREELRGALRSMVRGLVVDTLGLREETSSYLQFDMEDFAAELQYAVRYGNLDQILVM